MNPANNAAQPPQPIRDIAPPPDNPLGNPTQFANIPVQAAPGSDQTVPNNPILASHLPAPAPPNQPNQKAEQPNESVDVNKETKKPPAESKSSSGPVFAITMAVIVGIALMAAAFFAFRAPS